MTRAYRVRLRPGLLWLALALISVLGFLLFSIFKTDAGFPLDDGWIHQVFARNLAELGEWSYNPGQPVAGSTSPLWTLLLVPGYWLSGFHMAWTYTLGLLFLALSAGESFRLAAFFSHRQGVAIAAALFTLFDWRLVWAGASGMETLLFTFGTLLLARLYLTRFPVNSPASEISTPRRRVPMPLWLGLVGGLVTLVRPEGMALLGLVALDAGWRNRREFLNLATFWGWLVLGWVIPVLPYFVFNYALSGSLLPTTFGAKVSGYADFSPVGILNFVGSALFQTFLAGPLLFLVPGLLMCIPFLRAKKLDGGDLSGRWHCWFCTRYVCP